ncbi:MAG: hypothetical protein K8T91_21945 [Planctomycetes bacterium]|nr:hypothetical protein [Planctomycetota bacterium]
MATLPNQQASGARQATACRHLPPRLRVLFITGYQRTGGRLAEALVSESRSDVLLEEAIGAAAGMARLRDEVFDVVLASHEDHELDAFALVAGIRAGGSDEPVVVLGDEPEQELLGDCFEAGADAYLRIAGTTSQMLIWTVAKAVQKTALTRDNRRLVEAERQRLSQEHQEADRLLAQQRAVINDLEAMLAGKTDVSKASGGRKPPVDSALSTDSESVAGHDAQDALIPPALLTHYRELLRAYVIMGSGNLTDEMAQLADLLVKAGVSARQAMRMHLDVLEEMVRSLGSRSARHVIARADLLALEIMVHMVEGFRRQCSRHTPSLSFFGAPNRGLAPCG